MKSSLPILCYRNISPICGVAPAEFQSHLVWLKQNGWRTVTVDEAVDILKGHRELPEQAVAITFDDCYLDNWVHAAPLLRQEGFRASFGVATAYLHDGHSCRPTCSTPGAALRDLPVARDAWRRALDEDDRSAFMSRLELSLLAQEQGHVLFAHTHTHQACFCSDRPIGVWDGSGIHPGVHGIYPELQEGIPLYPSASAYAHDGLWPQGNDLLGGGLVARTTEERIEFCLGEFAECRERLEEITGMPPRVLAWPWGEYDEVSVQAAVLSGFEAALSMRPGANVPGECDLFALKRIRMQGGVSVRDLARRLRLAQHPWLARWSGR
ncbi:MAG: polysaccharide deacetylase family protein [Kiritimatiellae bacterium]|nr:polysaccharide deacetylase family protein [Kiritimatiellia bacterium]MBQ9344354.1 polysaccharide deacetylase family protein [Kiritimatiellia bacterium]